MHGGCWWRTGDGSPVAVRVTTTADLTAAVLAQSHSKTGESSGPRKKLRPARVVETYSAGVKLAMVARGEADLYVNTYENFRDWDICAGDLLVTEAGGTVTELNGEPIAYGRPSFAQRGGLLASNGRLHAAAIAGLRSPPP